MSNEYIEKLFSLKGKTIVVTGCSRGIGHALASGLSQAGGSVIGLSRSAPQTESNFKFLPCDLSDFNSIKDIFSKVDSLDVLVNCAGTTKPLPESIEEKIEKFHQTLKVNLKAPYYLCELAAEKMKACKSGSIINVTSIAAKMGFPSNPSYVSSKGGLNQLSKALAFDWAKDGIRVNNLIPGYIQTDMTKKSFDQEESYQQRLSHMMIPRWGKPTDLIGAAVFLASEASSYITGADIAVDGGWLAKGMSQ